MTATTGDRLLSDYLARLDTAALGLPPDRRAELREGSPSTSPPRALRAS